MSQNDSLLDVYVYENLQLIEQLEGILLAAEKSDRFNAEQVGAIFRILHTIKGSSGMMNYDALMHVSHAVEDLFSLFRENPERPYDHQYVFDLVFAAQDFIRGEIELLQDGTTPAGNADELIKKITDYHKSLLNGETVVNLKSAKKKKTEAAATPKTEAKAEVKTEAKPEAKPEAGNGAVSYRALLYFDTGCKMENVRAFGVIKSIDSICTNIKTIPEDVLKEQSEDWIIENGFTFFFESTASKEDIKKKILSNFFIKSLDFSELTAADAAPVPEPEQVAPEASSLKKAVNAPSPVVVKQPTAKPVVMQEAEAAAKSAADAQVVQQKQNYMSVKLDKLDKLMNLVGELVITETTVTKNPVVMNLHLDSFDKASRQLRKLTDELQDTVMSIRMIPISATFHRLERIVRDMCRKTGKQADLVIIGEDTEMDKSVIDNLGDPLMHLIRNSMDHGIETPEERVKLGKPPAGKIIVEARNTGGDVIISVSDDGAGLDRDILVKKGIDRGLIKKPEAEVTDKEAYQLIFAAGFSTNESVTEFSGRGVGMDVAMRSIEKMGGSINVDSTPQKGMSVQMRIPLTLAIIAGMQVGVAGRVFIVPLLSIQKSFKPKAGEAFSDPDGHEMILVRGKCYPIVRLYELFKIEGSRTNLEDGILVLIDADEQSCCLFVDELIGEQQTVIKPLPPYIARYRNWTTGIAGCTILGDGGVSLIVDINGLYTR
ncbi:MAG TPA: chemotaxis protein CheA [Clostridia bacterium]|nr:chemotaxis protein CheA [Clostridia bacterium]